MLNLKEYIGISFKSCGRDHDGLDCWGLLCLIYKERLDITLASYTDEYVNACFYSTISKVVNAHIPEWESIKKGTEQPFDVIIFRLRGLPIHIGMVVKSGQMIHVLPKLNTCLERYDTLLWDKRIRGFYRYDNK